MLPNPRLVGLRPPSHHSLLTTWPLSPRFGAVLTVLFHQTWQKKLSSVNVAQFPWDPAPQPPPQAPVNLPQATVPSNAPRPPPQPQHQHVPPVSIPQHSPMPAAGPAGVNAMGGPRIKAEPGTGVPPMPPMNRPMPMPTNPQSARDRAANHMQQKFGAAAAHSVSQLQAQAQAGHGYPQMHAANGQMPQIKTEPGYPSMGPSQTDGADDSLADWKAEVARRREAAQNGQDDHMFRDHLKQQMLGLEAGGVFRPLDQHESSSSAARRAAVTASLNPEAATSSTSSVSRIPGQTDGAEDGTREEEDEDAINSDLDDPDDLVAEDHDADESEGQVMLCTYDKVQRVKNKWKCTLKDGILTTGGREYVFHKGQGEFEW